MIGCDFIESGVSVVNVGGTGLRRFARIFLRATGKKEETIGVPVACITDLDILPDCAPKIVGIVQDGDSIPSKKDRRWRVRSDFTETALDDYRASIRKMVSEQNVETFVADEWTLEYDLACAGLARDLWVAGHLAKHDEQLHAGRKDGSDVVSDAEGSFVRLSQQIAKEEMASHVYALFTRGRRASKAIAAQYLAERLERRVAAGELDAKDLRMALPRYLVSAIEYVTRGRDRA